MSSPYPSLTATGWITDPVKRADVLLYDFFVANYSQSIIFRGQIKSLAYYIQRNTDMFVLRDTLQTAITSLLNSYYDGAEVSVKITPVKNALGVVDNDSNMDIQISAIVIQDGKRYSLGKLISVENASVKKVINV